MTGWLWRLAHRLGQPVDQDLYLLCCSLLVILLAVIVVAKVVL